MSIHVGSIAGLLDKALYACKVKTFVNHDFYTLKKIKKDTAYTFFNKRF